MEESYIRIKGKDYGPMEQSQLEELVRSGHIPFSAWVYWSDEWKLLAASASLRKLHPEYEDAPKSAPQKAVAVAELSAKAKLDVLIRRKSPRAPYNVDVVAHDNRSVIEGQTMVIGEGGLFLAYKKPKHKVGTRLKIHFRDSDLAAFNAVAEIVSVARKPVPGYCLRFVAISEADRKKISKFITTTRGGAR